MDDTQRAEGPLRIAMLSAHLPSESDRASGRQAHAIAGELASRGHEVELFSAAAPVPAAEYRHVPVPARGASVEHGFAREMARIDLTGYDIVHAHDGDPWTWPWRSRVHVRTIHGSCVDPDASHGRALGVARPPRPPLTDALATVVAATAVATTPEIRRRLPWVKTTIPHGVDSRRFPPGPGRAAAGDAADPVVLYVGAWGGHGRGAELARMFADRVAPRVPGARLRVVADDAPDEAPAGVSVARALTADELLAEYRHAWVFCHPSSCEPSAVPYVEAMMAGLPVVATPTVGAMQATRDGHDGIVSDIAGMPDVLVSLLTSKPARARMAARGRARAPEFDLARQVDRYEEIYRAHVRG